MAHVFLNGLDWCRAKFLAAGFVSNSYGVAPGEEGMGQLVVTSLLGAFCGMIGGFLLSQIMRYFAMISGRNLGYHVWTLAGAALGAGIFLALGLRNVDN